MTGFEKITVLLPPAVSELYLEAAKRILPRKDLLVLCGPPEQRTAILNGIVVEALVADFLASPSPLEAP